MSVDAGYLLYAFIKHNWSLWPMNKKYTLYQDFLFKQTILRVSVTFDIFNESYGEGL